MNYENYTLNDEEFKDGINNFFTQLLIEAKLQRKDAQTLSDLSSEQPTISYLIGQAGCGKTTLRKYLRDEKYTKNGECVVELDADKLATFHKYYDKLLKLQPDDFYKLTRAFVKPGNEIIHKTIINNKINVVKEKVMHKGEPDYQEVAEFKNGGYNVDMNVIAVDGYESFLCCIERDIALIKSGLDPRRVTKADHDRMYNPFIQELCEFTQRGLCDSINIYGRGNEINKPQLIYSSNRKSEDGLRIEECIKSIEGERKRMHDEIISNPSSYLRRIETARTNVNKLIEDKEIREEYLSQLSQLENEINREISFER